MSGVLILGAVIASGVLSTCISNLFGKKLVKTFSDNVLYSTITSIASALIIAMLGGLAPAHRYTIVLGIIYGLLLKASQLASISAMRCGPMSLTSMLTMASMVIPTVLSGPLWKEPATPRQYFGVFLILVTMAMSLNLFTKYILKKDIGSNEHPTSFKWFLLALVCFVVGGLASIDQKYLTVSEYASELFPFLFWGFLTSAVLGVILFLVSNKGKGIPVTMKLSPMLIAGVALTGIIGASLHATTMKAYAAFPVFIVAAVVNGARIVLVTILDMVLFGQKLTVEQILGILVGIAGILVIRL